MRRLEKFMIQKGFKEGETLDFNKFYYIEETGEYKEIDTEFIDSFIEALKIEGATCHTLYSAIVALKSFFAFIETMGVRNPLENYPNPYYIRKLRDRSLCLEHCNAMLKTAYRMDPFFRRYYVLILLMLVSGLRASEVCNLRKSQIIFDHNIIEVTRGQKNSENSVFITENLKDEIRRYLDHPYWYDWSNGNDREVFFNGNKPLKPGELNTIINIVATNAGIKRKVTAHDLRYTTASLLLESGVDIKTIQRQLRHRSIKTTIGYLPPTAEIRRALECYANETDLKCY